MAEQLDLFGGDVPPPSPLAELRPDARARAAAALARKLPNRALCESCGALITWAWTEKNEQMPVDAEPVEAGGIIRLDAGSAGRVIATVVSRGQDRAARLAGIPLHTSHFATCPHPDKHRKSADG